MKLREQTCSDAGRNQSEKSRNANALRNTKARTTFRLPGPFGVAGACYSTKHRLGDRVEIWVSFEAVIRIDGRV